VTPPVAGEADAAATATWRVLGLAGRATDRGGRWRRLCTRDPVPREARWEVAAAAAVAAIGGGRVFGMVWIPRRRDVPARGSVCRGWVGLAAGQGRNGLVSPKEKNTRISIPSKG
jgi:hypothetical protein